MPSSADFAVDTPAPLSTGRNRDLTWLLVAAAVLLLQVLPYLSHRWVTDESWYAGPGYSIAQGHGVADPAIGPNDLENRFDARPPGTALAIAGFFKVFGAGQIEARMASVLAGLVIVFLMYRLGRELLDEQGAILAALLVATDTFVVATSRTARPEALTVMGLLLSAMAMVRYARSGGAGWAFLSGLLIAGATMFHVTVLGYVLSFGLLTIVLDVRRKAFPLRGALSYSAGYFAGLIPFAVWIFTAPLGRLGFRTEYMARAAGDSLGTKLVLEEARYRAFVGLDVLKGHGLEMLPVRLPVMLGLLAATYLLWRYRRNWVLLEVLLVLPTLCWFVITANKSSRYMALLAPVISLMIAAAVTFAPALGRTKRVMAAIACFLIFFQFCGNLALIAGARKADYNRLTAEINAVIPEHEPVYATITFWLGLRNHPFLSYERTTLAQAINDYHARYFITGDRMMTQGAPQDSVFYSDLNSSLDEVERHSDLVGHFPDPYYGDIKVFRIR